MTAVEKLRAWADADRARQVETRLDSGNGKWYVMVRAVSPLAFQHDTGWEPSLEEAAAKAIDWLKTLGEEIPEG
jgi:hypothetical protein